MAPDTAINTVFMLSKYIWQVNQDFTIDLFDMTHFTSIKKIPFSTSEINFNPLGRFIRWGSAGLALSFKGGNVYFISGPFV